MFEIGDETITFQVDEWTAVHGEPPRLGTVFPVGDGRVVRLAVRVSDEVFGFRVVGRDDVPAPAAPQNGNGFAKNEFVPMVGRNFNQKTPGVFTRRRDK